jgi:membrane protein implicated in regulation of membrane protease activity
MLYGIFFLLALGFLVSLLIAGGVLYLLTRVYPNFFTSRFGISSSIVGRALLLYAGFSIGLMFLLSRLLPEA